MKGWVAAVWALLLLCALRTANAAAGAFYAGIGIADCTGPAAEVNMMGYAVFNQTARGIHTRQWARAYVFAEQQREGKRVLFVVVDTAMVSQRLTDHVIQKLQAEFPGHYSIDNVVLTATHTHAASGGFMEHFLYHITSMGFVRQSFDALADGILEAARAAHADLKPADLSWAEGELLEANINRSPTAYAANPPAERARYKYDVDKDMTVLRIRSVGADGKPGRGRGLITWFAVHPVSMSNTNRLLSSDNKGFASRHLEQQWAPKQQQMEQGFVAAFAQSNGADSSPNTLGTFCLDSGQPCDTATSTCGGNNQLCVGRGPGWPDEVKSTQIIGQRQADKAQELWASPGHAVSGPIDSMHVYIDISNTEVHASNFTAAGHTCAGAMGYSFAAGTTDGPGAQGFFQADRHEGVAITAYTPLEVFLNAAAKMTPGHLQKSCQGVKPILLNIGEALKPYEWVPKVTGVTLVRLGNFVIVCVPGEFTTMAGRRLRDAVRAAVAPAWGPDVKVVLTSLANSYASYVTTLEEYQEQRYEGGSTLYGPHTLGAYLQAAVALADAMARGGSDRTPVLPSVPPPADFSAKVLGFLPPVVFDAVPPKRRFGQVIKQPNTGKPYSPGQTVEATLWGANPRNNPRRGGTFLEVQLLQAAPGSASGTEWAKRYDDDAWCTTFAWERPKTNALTSAFSALSVVTVTWTVPADVVPGTYRIKYHGDAKLLLKMLPFEGVTHAFTVVA